MLAVDDIIVARLRALPMFGEDQVHVGQMVPPRAPGAPPVVVRFELPYLVYRSNVGLDQDRRLGGRRIRRSTLFDIVYVGGTQDQAKLAGEVARFELERTRIDLGPDYDNQRSGLIEVEEGGSQRIWRDDDAVRPDGVPLYYGVDQYAVPIKNPRAPVPVGP